MAEKTPEQHIKELEAALRQLREMELPEEKLKSFKQQVEDMTKHFKENLPEAVSNSNVLLKQMKKVLIEVSDAGTQFDISLKRAFKTMTGVEDASHTLIGSFAKLATESGGLDKIQKKLADRFEKTFTGLNIGVSIARKVVESTIAMTKEIDSQTAALNKSIGAGGEYNVELRKLEQSNRNLGITIGELGETYKTLINTFSEFGLMSETQRAAIAETTAQFEKFGVATASTSQILQKGTKVLGLTADQALDMEKQVIATAHALGEDLGGAAADLAAALPKLAAFGANATEIFKNLQIQSKNTGLEISELISISEQFMTFDAAAGAAGRLNAVLGTQMFDTMQMLQAQMEGPDAFAKLMSEQLQASVGDFETLDVFQQRAIANAMGLSVEQVRAMVQGEEAANTATDAMKRHNLTQDEMNELMAAGRGFAEELKIMMAEFAIAVQPLMTGLVTALRFMNGLLNDAPGIIKILTIAAVAFGTKFLIKLVATKVALIAETAAWGRLTAAVHRNTAAKSANAAAGFTGPVQPGMGTQMGLPFGTRAPAPAPRAGGRGFPKGAGLALGGVLAGQALAYGAEEGSTRQKAGGILSGAASGAMMGSFLGPWGAGIGGAIGGLMGAFQEGTDAYPGGPLFNVAGEAGPEMIVPPPGSAIINNANTKALARGQGSQGSKEVVLAVNNLSKKMDQVISAIKASGNAVIEMDGREVGRAINEHFGAPGSKPLRNVSGR